LGQKLGQPCAQRRGRRRPGDQDFQAARRAPQRHVRRTLPVVVLGGSSKCDGRSLAHDRPPKGKPSGGSEIHPSIRTPGKFSADEPAPARTRSRSPILRQGSAAKLDRRPRKAALDRAVAGRAHSLRFRDHTRTTSNATSCLPRPMTSRQHGCCTTNLLYNNFVVQQERWATSPYWAPGALSPTEKCSSEW